MAPREEGRENGREKRYEVDFPVFLSWQVNDAVHRVMARCVDLSPSGAKLETKDRLEIRTAVLVHSEHFGRMGMASIRYCVRKVMKYEVGLEFSVNFGLSDPVRQQTLARVVLDNKNQLSAVSQANQSRSDPG
jgi:PilZ domain-containing protein